MAMRPFGAKQELYRSAGLRATANRRVDVTTQRPLPHRLQRFTFVQRRRYDCAFSRTGDSHGHLFVNKERVDIAAGVPGDTPLLWVLRDNLEPHRHQVRLRHGAVRRLHGLPRRQAGALVPDAAVVAQGRRRDHDDRRPQDQGGAGRAGGVGEARRAAVRLLPVGPGDGRRGAAREEEEADRRRHRRRDDGQPLPLRHLRPHPRRDQGSGEEPRHEGDPP